VDLLLIDIDEWTEEVYLSDKDIGKFNGTTKAGGDSDHGSECWLYWCDMLSLVRVKNPYYCHKEFADLCDAHCLFPLFGIS
jgi:hypothetical protein